MPDRVQIDPDSLKQRTEIVPLSDLRPHPQNANNGDLDRIGTSIQAHGLFRAVVISEDGVVLAGNHTYMKALELGRERMLVHRLPLQHDHPQALEIMLADNGTRDSAVYDSGLQQALLEQVLVEQGDLAGTSYDQAFLDALVAKNAAATMGDQPAGDPDAVPEPPEEPVTKPGDLWLLGPHRLLCGDASDPLDWQRLMRTAEAALVLTDPPYGVNYQNHDSVGLRSYWEGRRGGSRDTAPSIRNDGDAALGLWRDVAPLALGHCRPGGVWYVTAPPGQNLIDFAGVLRDLGVLRQILVWAKDILVQGPSDYQYRHEAILYGWKEGAAHQKVLDRSESTVWEIPRPKHSPEHPNMKPVELVRRAICNSSQPGEVVLDPFAGSGTTLIAAHLTGRIAHLMEIEPRFCDVILRRFQEQTGVEPVLCQEETHAQRTASPARDPALPAPAHAAGLGAVSSPDGRRQTAQARHAGARSPRPSGSGGGLQLPADRRPADS